MTYRRLVLRLVITSIVLGLSTITCGSDIAENNDAKAISSPSMAKSPQIEYRALAERVQQAQKIAVNTPGHEYGLRLNSNWVTTVIKAWLDEKDTPEDHVSEAVIEGIRFAAEHAERGPQWPAPPHVKIPRTTGEIRIDGKLDDAAWADAVTFEGEYPFNEQQASDTPLTTWKLAWDDTYLYVVYDCRDTNLIAEDRERDDTVYFDDCVEIFILPDRRFRAYWEILVSPAGSLFDAVQVKHADEWGFNGDTEQDVQGLKYAVVVDGTLNDPGDEDRGYQVEMAIPFSELPGFTRVPPQAGHHFHFMLARLDKHAEGMTPYAFIPILGWGHNIWNHAEAELVE